MTYCQPADLDERKTYTSTIMAATHALPRHTHDSTAGSYQTGGAGALVFSAPHEHPQMRDGAIKQAEQGTGDLAFALAHAVGGTAIATAGPQTGDPNWDRGHPYTKYAIGAARNGAIIDLHMMQPRGFEVCLGLGPDHHLSRPLWQLLLDELLNADIRVALNYPYGSRGRTVVAQAAENRIPGIQVEISFDVFDPHSNSYACVISALARAGHTWHTLTNRT